ncbi:hypothetical protein [Rhizobium rhizogenes]|uniref:hypothetical protein n=1 Tax=Rhizobium rhizogenes TaxID=359 RepID=UPI0022B62444|nr:hypothetical protein [Rhizobium rhizogenes]MCZ7448139.1 hypothetical protein [Rhizobium rhizogenes]MCZ7465800.1 hypothetical protein [Rhizobium rhizogenes]
MTLRATDTNPFPGLSEVKTSLVDAGSHSYELLTELRIHPTEVEGEKHTVSVEVLEATITLELEGLDIVPQSKRGQPVVPADGEVPPHKVRHFPVKAVGRDKWKVSEKQAPLDGVYIDFQPLCGLSPIVGSNRRRCVTSLGVKQKHLKLDALSPPIWGVSQDKLLAVLLAKSLHDRTSSGIFRGELIISRSEVDDEA